MGWKCCVPNCRSGYFKEGNSSPLSFHAFPLKDVERTKKWVRAIHRKDYLPTANSRVCSKHFSESNFKQTSCDVDVTRMKKRTNEVLKIKLLKDNAIPFLFPGQPEYMSKKSKLERNTSTSAESRFKKQMEKLDILESALFESDKVRIIITYLPKCRAF